MTRQQLLRRMVFGALAVTLALPGLRAVAEGRPFEAGLRDVIAFGGDTDSNGAVTGALLGALHGASALPSGWLDRLADRSSIEAEARTLAAVVRRGSG